MYSYGSRDTLAPCNGTVLDRFAVGRDSRYSLFATGELCNFVSVDARHRQVKTGARYAHCMRGEPIVLAGSVARESRGSLTAAAMSGSCSIGGDRST